MIRHFILLAAAALLAACPAAAQIWDGGGGDDFLSTAKNWNTNTIPANNGTAVLQFAGGTRPDPVAGQPWSLSGIGFQNTTATFNLSGQPLTIGGAGLANTTAKGVIVDNAVVLSANQIWGSQNSEVRLGDSLTLNLRNLDLQGPGSFRFNGSISPGNIDITNGATVRLAGFVNCDVDLLDGTLEIDTDDPQPAGTFINMGDNTYFKAVGAQNCDNGIILNGDVFYTGGGSLHLDRGLGGGGELVLDTTGSLSLGGGYTSTWNSTVVVEKGRLELAGAQPGVPMLRAGGLQVGDDVGDPATAEIHALVPEVLQAGVPVIFKDGSLVIEGDHDFPFIDVRGGDLQVNGDFTAGQINLTAADRTATIAGNWVYAGSEPYLPVNVPDGSADPDLHFTVDRAGGPGILLQGGGTIVMDGPGGIVEPVLYVENSTLILQRGIGVAYPIFRATNSTINLATPFQFSGATGVELSDSQVEMHLDQVCNYLYLDNTVVDASGLIIHGDIIVDRSSELNTSVGFDGGPKEIRVTSGQTLSAQSWFPDGDEPLTLTSGGTLDVLTPNAHFTIGAGTLKTTGLVKSLEVLGPQSVMEVPVRGDATLDVEGTMTMHPGGTLRLSIGHNAEFGEAYEWSRVGHTSGFAPGSTIDLAGTLEITLGQVFDIQEGDSFVLVEAGTITGEFDQVLFPDVPVEGQFWDLEYTPTQVILRMHPLDGVAVDLTDGADARSHPIQTDLWGVAGIEFTMDPHPGAKYFSEMALAAVRVDSIGGPIFGGVEPSTIGVRIYRTSDQALLASADDRIAVGASIRDFLFPLPVTLQAGETYRLVLQGGGALVTTRTANNQPSDPSSLLRVDGAYRTLNQGDIFPVDPDDELFLATLQFEMAGVSGVDGTPEPVVTELALNAAPNPFNPRTSVHFDIPQESRVRIDVIDLRGRRVATLAEGVVPIGRHEVVFDGRSDAGEALPSGIYFVRLATADGSGLVKKVTLLQ